VRGIVSVLAVLATALVPASAAAQTEPISPGSQALFPNAGCTLNFIFDGTGPAAGRVFAGVAAHCSEAVGDEVRMGDGTDPQAQLIGRVAVRGAYNPPPGAGYVVVEEDWSLVEILPHAHGRVAPEMVGHPGFPTGVADPTRMASGDVLQFSGWGTATQATAETRERRQGQWMGGDEIKYDALAPLANPGDSGGPIVDVKSGGALGVVSTGYRIFCTPGCTLEGPTIAHLIEGAAAEGVPVRLRAAGEKAPTVKAAPATGPGEASPTAPAAAPAPAPAEPQAAPAVLSIDATRTCIRAGRLALRLSSTAPLREARITTPRRKSLTGAALTRPIRLTGLRRKKVSVTVAAHTTAGERLTARRTFRSCRLG
jgi:hypothetical protein